MSWCPQAELAAKRFLPNTGDGLIKLSARSFILCVLTLKAYVEFFYIFYYSGSIHLCFVEARFNYVCSIHLMRIIKLIKFPCLKTCFWRPARLGTYASKHSFFFHSAGMVVWSVQATNKPERGKHDMEQNLYRVAGRRRLMELRGQENKNRRAYQTHA
jgi:hypothetical protein